MDRGFTIPGQCLEMDRKKLTRNLGEIGRDIVTAFVIVAVIMLSLYAYCGIWPPMVVVESGSMEHPPSPFEHKSYIGVIDTGDMVFVKKVNASQGADVITYVQGEASGYSRYGGYGDVIIYRPNGLKYRGDGTPVVPIIHRLVVWIDVNSSHVNPDFQSRKYFIRST
jgi:signal peptidase